MMMPSLLTLRKKVQKEIDTWQENYNRLQTELNFSPYSQQLKKITISWLSATKKHEEIQGEAIEKKRAAKPSSI
ncbi:hypothetical protein [Undibacterium sp. TC9W]|uniref:hypothetical protein n=1 Tax=Undibacterium sp. TC9W TaxID=3413053 RepID=UPI003BF09209